MTAMALMMIILAMMMIPWKRVDDDTVAILAQAGPEDCGKVDGDQILSQRFLDALVPHRLHPTVQLKYGVNTVSYHNS